MREILFRGKRIDNGEWIEGDLLTPTDIVDCTEIAENTGMGDRYDVDPETVGQYTGLTDKNGMKIFEGDIVKFISEVYEIAYIEKHARFAGKREDVALAVFPCEYAEVIGNIHDGGIEI